MSMFRRAPLDAAAARQVLANWGAPEAIPDPPPQKPPVVSGQSSVVNGQGTTDKGRQAAYVSLAEAAERLSCAPKTLERWLVAGKIPGFKMGRRWRVRLGEVEAVLRAASGRNGTPRA